MAVVLTVLLLVIRFGPEAKGIAFLRREVSVDP